MNHADPALGDSPAPQPPDGVAGNRSGTPVLKVEDLKTHFFTKSGTVRAVDGVSFTVNGGETVGIVGESGSGKTMTARSILRLVPHPGRIVEGRILFGDRDVLAMNPTEIREYRGGDVAMIFQDPMASLNPVVPVGRQIAEAMKVHSKFSRTDAERRVVPLLEQTQIPDAARRVGDYPHQFSGGMRQRVMIAMGISNEPSLLIADEPTTALDVTVQSEIIELLRRLNAEKNTAIILITHNMAVVASLCTFVIVMYAGRIVESGATQTLFDNPQHPYTWLLLRSIPRVDKRAERLLTIEGAPPDLAQLPAGCKFHPRCPFKVDRCEQEEPPLADVGGGQFARCWVLMRNVAQTTENDD